MSQIWETHPLFISSVYLKYESNMANRQVYMLWNSDFACSHMTLTLDLQTVFKVTAHPMTIYVKYDTIWVKYELDWTKGRDDMLRTRILFLILLLPNLRPRNMVQNTFTPFTQRHSVGEVWVHWAKGREDVLETSDNGVLNIWHLSLF